ncbi:competence protein ComK [Oceanobacillus halotolerans]|uniref:competence protein ComK n=1 Tax=Oceanobacillus halotolerans TaxID=2663380 RepID=UPI0013DCFFD8|nr:competence protein ComK [Oceanobacillus halotolerans]
MFKNYFISSYEITPVTLAVIAHVDATGNHVSYVLEEEGDYYVSVSPTKIIDHACKFFGSSLRGRQDGTKEICGITHKAPISIDPISGMYFFPTSSPSSNKCSWISHSHVTHVKPRNQKGTEIVFKNGKTALLEMSHGSAMNQLHRTAEFRYRLDARLKHLRKHNPDMVAEP